MALLKLDLSDDSQNTSKPKTIVSASGSNINSDHTILMEKFKALTTKIDSEFLKIRKELKDMRDGRDVEFIEEYEIKPILTMPNPSLIMFNSPIGSPFPKDYTVHIPKIQEKVFKHDKMLNHVDDEELKSFVEKDEVGLPKEPNKEWKLNEKVVPATKTFINIDGTRLKFPT
ncbi:hypothetical protein Tco_1491397 [Tanacetum coccineum]